MNQDPLAFQYNNVTISGLPGTGSTTLLKELKQHLPDWEAFSGGEFMRSYALEKQLFQPHEGVHHDASHYEDDFDRKIDFGMRDVLSTRQHYVLEAWLSGFFAQEVAGVLKVLLVCEDSLRIDRIVNRDNISVTEAKEHIFKREETNRAKWRRMYHKEWQEWVVAPGKLPSDAEIDFWNPALYDLVIDTYSHSKEETLELLLDSLVV